MGVLLLFVLMPVLMLLLLLNVCQGFKPALQPPDLVQRKQCESTVMWTNVTENYRTKITACTIERGSA